MTDRARKPVDIGRLEGGDLTERVVVELPEWDDGRVGCFERRGGSPPEMADAVPNQRAGRRRRARWLPPDQIRARRRLPTEGRAARSIPDGRVVRPIGPTRIHSRGDRAGRLRRRRSTPPTGDPRLEGRAVRLGPGTIAPGTVRTAGQCRVGIVDLRHATRRHARGSRVIAGEVWVVGSGESAPGSLDLGRRCASLDAKYGTGVSCGHHP